MSASCIYEGTVRHRRNAPTLHQFDFSCFMLLLDLDELPTLFRKNWLWSADRPALARFRESDHLTGFQDAGGLRQRVDAAHVACGLPTPTGSVRLLTQLRYFGFGMNPVSFFYCYDRTGQVVESILAEVNNTPWGEQHVYAMDRATSASGVQNDASKANVDQLQADAWANHEHSHRRNLVAPRIDKTFHVSPFMSLEMFYRMVFSAPGEKLAVKIENHSCELDAGDRRKLLDVTMRLTRKPLTASSLNWLLLKYPFYSFKTIAAIYWQALRLSLKRVPFYSHPERVGQQQSVPPTPAELAETPAQPQDQQQEISAQADSKSVLVSR